ncbi:MAG: MucB/RseB C-terminal domain-containing protein [Rhodocyclales bacterium]|nr:MucB/RseB C-terminal domain-containing protein [Rhodocyclales bacterium]
MKQIAAALVVWICMFQSQAIADVPSDPISWLGRIASAGQRLNYTGTFIYQSGPVLETSRITHLADASGEHERLEVLDGSPREVTRSNAEVRCVLPDQRMVIVDRSGGQRGFPVWLPATYASVAENYRVSKGEVSRVAGHDTQLLMLEPRDDLRYGHLLWAEMLSGLLLKARMVDESNRIIEQFAFSDVRIGGDIDPGALKSRLASDDGWRVLDTRGQDMKIEDSEWMLTSPLPGYALKSIIRRPLGPDRGDILHLVYSDGLAAISVFVEPTDPERAASTPGTMVMGAINIYKRDVDGHMVTALGAVPMRALQLLGDGMELVVRQ